MSKLKLLTIAVVGLLMVNIGMLAFLLLRKPPHPMEREPSMKQEGPKNIIIEKLHLDKAQVAQYESLIKTHRETIKNLNDSIKTAKNNLYQSLKDTDFTGEDSLINRMVDFQKQIERAHYGHFTAIKKLCKPGQLEDFNKLTNELARFFSGGKQNKPAPRD